MRRDGEEDPDEDGLPTCAEVLAGTNPDKADTDGDLLADGDEEAHGVEDASGSQLGGDVGGVEAVGGR